MANKYAASHTAKQYAGDTFGYGAASAVHGSYTLSAAASGDTVFIGQIPAGSLITDFRVAHGATGVSDMDFGYTGAPTALLNAYDATLAGSVRATTMAPIRITSPVDLFLTLNAGTPAATVDVVVNYIYKGTTAV